MKAIALLLLLIAAIGGGIYVGGYLMFVGGIVAIFDTIKSGALDGHTIAFGVLGVLLAAPAGWGIVALTLLPTKYIR